MVVYHGTGLGELFDLRVDPQEFDNLWDDPRFTEVKSRMTSELLDDLMTTIDVGGPRIGRY